jgi:hypothetical protein
MKFLLTIWLIAALAIVAPKMKMTRRERQALFRQYQERKKD